MAEQLDDGEFWLPSQFLTDDDDEIISDLGSGSGFASDDDWAMYSKLAAVKLLSSPQSTLFGCEQVSNSSHGSPKDSETTQNDENETLNLLNKATMKLNKSGDENRSVGTGFFDCSNSVKRRVCLPSTTPQLRNTPLFQPPPFHFHPQYRYNNAAWPPLPGQAQPQAQAQSKPKMGTGVFLPKPIVTPPPASKKKSDGNVVKTKKNKSLQRRDARSIRVKDDEIQLPSEWVY